ncbi:extracellular serine/threonine protein CG31145-like [Biomphalaria glabrata]|uniref:Extracellular serine/threonine protein CG31145-like n=1 Tax=Biomphalaria glabrata TaxID=6526 RepID=A0A9W2ZNW4_BIOGL|nr:extracellular serine/threonine protein CG31145-like [Biomphalaria glabrata]XP_055876663.1 extracellular serine/threonine protein CG31145-like [Biomphalaria glabrata]
MVQKFFFLPKLNSFKLVWSRRYIWKLLLLTFCLLALIAVNFQPTVQYAVRMAIHRSELYNKLFAPSDAGGCRVNYSIPEVDTFIREYQGKSNLLDSVFKVDEQEPYLSFLAKLNKWKRKGKLMKEFVKNNNTWAWEIFHQQINQYFLYDPEDTSYYQQMLKDLNQRKIIFTDVNNRSSHLVLIVTFDNGMKGLYKFMRTPRDHEVLPNHFFFSDIERAHAEIASFHLDKVLGFYRVPPTVGRVLNITEDIGNVGVELLTSTLHRSPVGNLCFFGKCKDYCKVAFSICGTPDTIEGAMSVFLPPRGINQSHYSVASPWMRVYHHTGKATWELSEDYCETNVKKREGFQGRKLLDYSDIGVFDFLIGNLDRHHVELFQQFNNDTFILHLDNGRGFGKSKYDCMSCMSPVRQCCMIRRSTLAKLVKLYIGPDSLSHVLRKSLEADPLSPILWEPHLDALDRRVGQILKVVRDCIAKKGKLWHEVIIDDGYN